ncbi:MAG: hypothetical protein ABI591_28045 [Kofleriaceae bacterium]
MSGQGKVLASTTVAVVAILIAAFSMTWFRMHLEVTGDLGIGQAASLLSSAKVQIGLHSATACMPDGSCSSIALGNFDGLYPTMATFTFWVSVLFAVVVAYQAIARVLTGQAGEALSRVGYFLVLLALCGAVATGFMFAPETGANDVATVIVHRTWAPGLMILGYIAGVIALVICASEEDELPKSSASMSIPIKRVVISEPIVPLARSRVVTAPTIELVPEPAPAPVAPPAAVVVITRPASVIPAAGAPTALRRKLAYATARAVFHKSGIDAEREDGTHRKVLWPDVVGVVARRLPAEPPYDGETFIDLVSVAGATLRFLPWTELTGAALDDALATGNESERARTFVQLVAMACPDARLDSATRTFLGGRGLAAQLPNAATLAQHDQRLA